MSNDDGTGLEGLRPGAPILLQGGTVLTMDRGGVLEPGDVLVEGQRITDVGPSITAPDGAFVIDCSGGIVMPGMVDTHRHMWQTAMRGFGADWTLTQYFVFYYLRFGKLFRPEDIYAGNLLAALEAIDAGVTTTVDWSHGLQTVEHGEAALQALQEVPGRFVLAYGNLLGAPWEWTKSKEFRDFVSRHFSSRSDLIGLQLAFDVIGAAEFPERGAFESARELDLAVTTHAGVWGATNDNGIRLMSEHGFMTESVVYVHAATLSEDSYQRIAASGASASVSTESEQSAGQGYPPTWQLRRHRIPVSLSMDTSVWWSGDLFSAMRATLSADRSREHLEAHAREETVVANALRAEEVVGWATTGGARAIGLGDVVGTITPGKKADLVLVRNDRSPVMFPILHPFGHVVFQAGRGDVEAVLVDGRVVKHRHALVDAGLDKARHAVAATIEHLQGEMGADAWQESMNPELPKAELIPNPYTYADWDGGRAAARHGEGS
ncbi:MAG TPA: amidohydrolase family protein [Acidimicrobiales bacterium]|nr:amidohydrolase family protein [Acidimicrobiales bacterium]